LKLSRQSYYRWLPDPITGNEMVRAYRANALFDANQDDPEFGHCLLADETRKAGGAMADRTAWRICRDNAWWSTFGEKRGCNGKKPGPTVHDDLCTVTDASGRVRHEFSAERPNQLWLTDITEHRTTTQGKLYLCAVKDVFSNKIVRHLIDSRMKSSLAVNALDNAVAMRGDVAGCVVPSDRGSQFRSRKFLRALARHRMVGSMGRVASCDDNAPCRGRGLMDCCVPGQSMTSVFARNARLILRAQNPEVSQYVYRRRSTIVTHPLPR
jgi:putative transposase